MSQLEPSVMTCPCCAATRSLALYTSLDADTMPHEVDAIVAGAFEKKTCTCGYAFRPEHPMLFVSHARRLWIVMEPLAERPQFAAIERGVEEIIAKELAEAALLVAERSRGIRPRLVFGQHMLAEAVRTAYANVDAALLECAKLLAVRRDLAGFMVHGPCELCFERIADDGALVCGVYTLAEGARVGEMALPADSFADVMATRAVMQQRFPALFEHAYVSATRYLIGP